jgi:hypothetical protein
MIAMTRTFLFRSGALLAALLVAAPSALAQKAAHPTKAAPPPAATPEEEPRPQATLRLSALLAASDKEPVRGGVIWRIFEERAEANGSHRLVGESGEAAPSFVLPDGVYIAHAAYGLAGATRRIVLDGRNVAERIALNAGALKLIDVLGEAPLPPQRLQIAIYVPERGNSEAKLVLANARAGDVVCLPEGVYHIVSTLLDTTQGAQGENNTTNSVVTADLRVPAGKLIEATLRHRAATMTLKLVKAPGGEALANTSFSVLTPGGDVIRELIGAFPALVLAEGEYVVIARNDGKTYQQTFKVQSTQDKDVEVVARAESAPERPPGEN